MSNKTLKVVVLIQGLLTAVFLIGLWMKIEILHGNKETAKPKIETACEAQTESELERRVKFLGEKKSSTGLSEAEFSEYISGLKKLVVIKEKEILSIDPYHEF